MYTEALRQIREAASKGKVGAGATTPGQPPRKSRKHAPDERRAFYEKRGWLPAVTPETASGSANAENGEAGQHRQE